MAKNTNRVASAFAYVAALGLAFGASAAHWELSTSGDVTYASEIFGEDAADLELTLMTDDPTSTEFDENEGTYVDLAMLVPDPGSVAANSEITVTVTLNGATFGNTVQINDFKTQGDGLSIVNGSKKDGRVGDRSVSVGFKATTEIRGAGPAATNDDARPTIRLVLSSIEGAAGLATPKAEVTASASVELVGTAGGNAVDFPTDVTPPGVRDDDTTPDVDESMKDGKPVFKPADNAIASSVQSYDFGATSGGMGPITLDDRTKIKGTQVALASLTRTITAAKTADNDADFDGAGNVKVNVSGDIPVNDDDNVFYDLNGDKKMTENEMLEVDDGGASGTFRATPSTVYYAPGGEDELKAGMLTATFSVVFDATSSVDPGDTKASGMLVYDGVAQEARAYAIPNPDRIDDIGNVRIRCEAGTACTVFLSCDGQDGVDYFGEVGAIDSGATMVLDSQAVADKLGADDGWMGRLSCDVLSSGDASVQVLVRSGASNVLVNNTFVDDNSVTEMLNSLSSAVNGVNTAVSAVRGVVDTINTNNPDPDAEDG
jgi:hypothetical protein